MTTDIDFIITMEQILSTHNKLSGLKKLRPYRLPFTHITPIEDERGVIVRYVLADVVKGSEPRKRNYTDTDELKRHVETRISLMRALLADLHPGTRRRRAA